MSESPGKHPETQEMRAERDCKAVERLLSCQACKTKPSMAEHPGKRITSTFPTKMAREMATCWRNVPPGSRAWVDNFNGKRGLPALVMFH